MSQWQPISQIAQDVQAGRVTAMSLVEQALKTIDTKHEFSAIIIAITDRARERAKEVDERIAKGEKVGPLAGVPCIVKDNFLTFGVETTAASNILKGFNAPYQATVINKLEAAGAIVVAKANLDAFGHGASTEHSDFMITKNPHDQTRVPGGSSGGPAAAVVLDMAPFALGTDTGGSNRQPASYCGCVGYRPTYGLVSRSGVVAMASSADTIGPLTKSVDDLAYVLDVIAGKDPLDSTTIDRDTAGYQLTAGNLHLTSQKIGVIKEYMGEGVDPGVKAAVQSAVSKLQTAGAEVQEISLPSLPLALAAYYVLVPAEISSNLSRYDGQRYGYSDASVSSLDDSYNQTRSQGFGQEAKRRIMIGTYVLSSGYYDAYYKKAQKLRTKLINEFTSAFKQVDFLAGPVAPTTAFKIGEMSSDPLQMFLVDIMTVSAALAGIPAISLPVGSSNNMPVGLQFMGPPRSDRALLALSKTAEEVLA